MNGNQHRTGITLLSAALLAGALVACGGAQTGGTPSGIQRIEVSPATASVAVGGTVTLNATARDAQGQVVPNVAFSWKSSSEAVASVANGVVRGVTSGNASVTASAGGVTSAPVTVNVAPAADFDLSLSTDKLSVITGASATVTVTLNRHAGFTRAVTVSLTGLPAGASAAGVSIPEGQSSATLTVSASAGAPHSQPTPVTVTARATDATVTRPLTVTVRGPAGSLDTTFGAAGVSVQPVGIADDYANAMLVQPDGKVLVAGTSPAARGNDFAVLRFDRDGQLDTSFGQNGRALVDFAGGSDAATSLALQPDGKIIVAGEAGVDGRAAFGAARLTAGGATDGSFGTNGKATVTFGTAGDRANAVIVQPDGKIVLGGEANMGSASGVDFALARLNANGQPDATFSGGTVTTALKAGNATDTIRALALQGDKIIAVGGDGDFALARYSASGALDASFGSGGTVTGVFGTNIGSAKAVVVDATGRLLVAGNSNQDTAIAAFSKDGALDPSFGSAGKTVIALSDSNWDEATALAVQADGKPVLGGWVYEGGSSSGNFAVTRLTANGQPDAGFGTNGTTITHVAPGTKSDEARALALQPDERIPATRILLAGPRNDSNSDFALTRYWP